MGRGSTFVQTKRLRELDISSRDDLDQLCHHETDEMINLYLFKAGSARGVELVYVNPDGRRSRARMESGHHLCWYPRKQAQEMKRELLAPGHDADGFAADIRKMRLYRKEFREFLHMLLKLIEELIEEKAKRNSSQLRLVVD